MPCIIFFGVDLSNRINYRNGEARKRDAQLIVGTLKKHATVYIKQCVKERSMKVHSSHFGNKTRWLYLEAENQ